MTGALLATGLWIPALLAIATVVPYLLLPDAGAGAGFFERRDISALLLGLLSALVIWLLAAVIGASYARADRASPAAFTEIVERLTELRSRIAAAEQFPDPDRGQVAAAAANRVTVLALANRGSVVAAALMTASKQVDELERLLGLSSGPSTGDGTRWIRGTGYIEAWRRLHRAEEALLMFEPAVRVVDAAVEADLRLDGSAIAARDELRRKLAVAIEALDPNFSKYRHRGARIGD
jgi:hypothetical protein